MDSTAGDTTPIYRPVISPGYHDIALFVVVNRCETWIFADGHPYIYHFGCYLAFFWAGFEAQVRYPYHIAHPFLNFHPRFSVRDIPHQITNDFPLSSSLHDSLGQRNAPFFARPRPCFPWPCSSTSRAGTRRVWPCHPRQRSSSAGDPVDPGGMGQRWGSNGPIYVRLRIMTLCETLCETLHFGGECERNDLYECQSNIVGLSQNGVGNKMLMK